MKTLIKQKTIVATVRALDLSIMEEICIMLGVSHETYFKDQYAQYERFVEIAVAPSQMQAVRYSKLFRGFWNNEWSIRNKKFITFCEQCERTGCKRCDNSYFNLHDAIRLAGDDLFMRKFDEILLMIMRKEGKQC